MTDQKDKRDLLLQIKKSLPKEVRDDLFVVFNSTPLPVLLTGPDFEVLSANMPLLTLLGYDLPSIKGKLLSEFLSPREFDLLSKRVTTEKFIPGIVIPISISASGGRQIKTFVFIDKTEKAGISLNLIYFLSEKPGHMAGSPKLQMSDDLQAATKTGLFKIDINHQRFYGSAMSFKMLGLVNRSGYTDISRVTDLIYKKGDREKIDRFLMAPDSGYPAFETEFRIRLRKDEEKTIKTIRMICYVENSKNPSVFHGILRDISSEKRVEKELTRARNRAESANRFKAVFLTNLSHELRTPMNAIIGFSELLKAEQSGNGRINEYLSIIKNKGNYLMSLVDDVIELSRIETGDITIRKSSFGLVQFMNELYSEFEVRKKEKDKGHIELLLDIPAEFHTLELYTDPGRLHQILASILSNAFKFTEKGHVEFGFTLSAKYYRFYVLDTGIGLSPDDQRRIFNRFEEIEDKALTKLGGTGLSLTIAKKIIDQLGGKIKVRSALNSGSWFQISLPVEIPVKLKEEMIHQTGNIRDIDWKDKVILVAEDEELNFRFLEAVLQKTQAKILRAKNGIEAIKLCKNIHHIDMILMDIKMPVMNGNDATIEIKRERPDLPIIAQTAFSFQEEIAKCREAGCDDYVTKPIDIKMLINKMSRFFQK